MSSSPSSIPLSTVEAEAEKYDTLDRIGNGSFGIIRKIRRKSNGLILCRKEINYIKMSAKEKEQLMSEFNILSSLRHPNIVAYYQREHLKDSHEFYLYMEYCGGGDLGMVIRNLKSNGKLAEEEFVWRVLSQLATALYRCHNGTNPPEPGSRVLSTHGKQTGLRSKQAVMILHRDLKPDNIFLGEDQQVKLGDFGLSKILRSHDFASTYVGTPFYMSPEICSGEKYTLFSDIWALGCIIYELCAKEPPFNARTHIQLIQKIREGKFRPLPSLYSNELRNVIASCLRVNQDHRPDTGALLSNPVVRLVRKEMEMSHLNRTLRAREEAVISKTQQVEQAYVSLEQERAKMKVEIGTALCREWEAKARQEIDRLVQLEISSLRQRFETEVQHRVNQDVQKRIATDVQKNNKKHSTDVPSQGSSAAARSSEADDLSSSSTSLSTLSLEPANKGKNAGQAPAKPTLRTPLARATVMFDDLPDASPMSLDSPWLSSPDEPKKEEKGPTYMDRLADKDDNKAEKEFSFSDDEYNIPSPTLAKSFQKSQQSDRGQQHEEEETEDKRSLTRAKTMSSMPDPPTSTTAPEAPSSQSGFASHTLTRAESNPLRPIKSPRRILSAKSTTAVASVPSDENNPNAINIRKSATFNPKPIKNARSLSTRDTTVKHMMQRHAGGRSMLELHKAEAKKGWLRHSSMSRVADEVSTTRTRGTRELERKVEAPMWDPNSPTAPSPFIKAKVFRNQSLR